MNRGLAFLGLLALAFPLRGQTLSGTPFLFDAIPFQGATADSTRLDLLLSIPYNAIGFEHQQGVYVGSYRLHLTVQGNGRKWYDSTFIRSVRSTSYRVSTGEVPAFEFYQQRVTLPPGDYTATATLMGERTERSSSAERKVTAADYRHRQLAVSGLMLVSRIREDSSGYVITPMVADNISLQSEGYFLFFEVYNEMTAGEFLVQTGFRLANHQEIIPGPSFGRNFPSGRSQQWIRLPATGLARGTYEVELKLVPLADTTKILATTGRQILVGESRDGTPTSEAELNERISQLRYVASQEAIDHILEAGSFPERTMRYGEFWRGLDPTPGTLENEAMEEYFRRIDYANQNFRSYAPGWQTDKGHVFIVYGPPDNTSSDPFSSVGGGEVETWEYFGRNMKLVFVDESGFGDFRLVTRIPSGEKFTYSS